jgi:hypothetical protein
MTAVMVWNLTLLLRTCTAGVEHFTLCSLVELASILNVDYSHVEHAAQQIVKSDRDTHLVLGTLSFAFL